MISTVIVDDEPPARRRLRMLLGAEPDIEISGEYGDAAEAARAILESRPHLVFLDIQMPEGDGFGVLESLPADERPAVIFVTAHSEHAVRAFDVQAIDYLLKPFTQERLRTALDHVRLHRSQRPEPSGQHPHRPAALPPRRLPVEAGGRVRLLETAHIDYLRSERNYVRIHARTGTYLVRESLVSLEARLDPAEFLRVHRSLIVRLDRIQEVETLEHGDLGLRLAGGTKLIASRRYRDPLRLALGIATPP